MIIGTTQYDEDGDLMVPSPIDMLTRSLPGAEISAEPGHYHKVKFEALSEKERTARSREFLSTIGRARGFVVITWREYEVRMGSYVRYGVETVYAVELPARSRSGQNSSSSSRASGRSRAAATRPPSLSSRG